MSSFRLMEGLAVSRERTCLSGLGLIKEQLSGVPQELSAGVILADSIEGKLDLIIVC